MIFSPKMYRYLIKEGYLPKPTPSEIKSAKKHNKELARKLSEAVDKDFLYKFTTPLSKQGEDK